jgi:hypothetical protein
VNISGAVKGRFDSLEPGISINQVSATIGSPDKMVGEIVTAYGQRVMVWEYTKITFRIVLPIEEVTYWVYLVDEHFLKYTPQGVWPAEAGIVYRTDYSDFTKHWNAH